MDYTRLGKRIKEERLRLPFFFGLSVLLQLQS